MAAIPVIAVAPEAKSQAAILGTGTGVQEQESQTMETTIDPPIPIPFEKNKNMLESNAMRPRSFRNWQAFSRYAHAGSAALRQTAKLTAPAALAARRTAAPSRRPGLLPKMILV
jgi:hypothetical protein